MGKGLYLPEMALSLRVCLCACCGVFRRQARSAMPPTHFDASFIILSLNILAKESGKGNLNPILTFSGHPTVAFYALLGFLSLSNPF
jgi:hypothetical protein